MTALIYCPFPDAETARAVADTLLTEKLVACMNLMPAHESIFEWNGERGTGEERGALFKTDAGILEQAVARMEELHPYEAPAILGWPCPVAGEATKRWLGGLSG